MAARKLQTEIDRTLKKVTEGVELFESIYDKMQACTNPTQKDKLETDLKTQIKKLQRLRDQIKTWLASNDIKDKTQLLEYRRLIETQMEKFKACEKEMKTKAFSKEGLIAAMRLDPAEKAKHEASTWITSMIDELTRQVELSEAEIETLNNTKRKHKGAANERQSTLEGLNDRRKWHASRLEIVLRLLENGSLSPDSVNELKDGVTFFVESNTEEGFEEDESIYDDLNLDEEESALGLGGDDSDSDDDALPPIRYAAVASAAVNPPTPQHATTPAAPAVPTTPAATSNGPSSSTAPSIPPSSALEQQSTANTSSPSFTQPSLSNGSPIMSSIASPPGATSSQLARATPPPQSALHSFGSPASSQALSDPVPQSSSSPKRTSLSIGPAPTQQQPSSQIMPPGLRAQSPLAPPPGMTQAPQYPPGVSIQQNVDESAAPGAQFVQRPAPSVPAALADLAQSFDAAKQKAANRMNNLDQVHKALQVSYDTGPVPQDTEKPKYYVPRNTYPTPPYYPQQPISSLSTPSVFSQLDVDTLFYVFYFLPGTYQQYLAAKELKKQSWRFHLKYLTWFQRHSEPQAITDEYEQGVYVYFDWEGSWCQRKKSDFRFEYRYLSED
ncbi:hypothetical protein EXIGLDRAFT_600161 [Exidia glandulosa HHB12029]|uniref:General negative regulator of transcription subunit n=1 Tax=Exidia glandulosa HHB12029 TaxID=1314781 RepID=A0A165QX81_EXIGL|nr:hypothetical protein EXIGLDRAFT_600161 [Exidia glandulosa HHB12029]